MNIPIVRNVLEANASCAQELREFFAQKNTLVLNIISSPGAGKTSLLERTLTDLKAEFRMAVIEGDLQTDNDAKRIAATGAQVVQINTEGGCHLSSAQIKECLSFLDTDAIDILFIENVGNLVCPVEFDCGEDAFVALLSVTEGADKPEKYPLLFHKAQVMLINKIDLLPFVDFDLDIAKKHATCMNKDLQIIEIACHANKNAPAVSDEGLQEWYASLRLMLAEKRAV